MKDINIELTCPDCDTKFSLEPKEILEKESIACPQCNCQLTEGELIDLKSAIKYMLNTN